MPEKVVAQEGYIQIRVSVTPAQHGHPAAITYMIDVSQSDPDEPRELELWGSEWGMLCAAIDAAREALR